MTRINGTIRAAIREPLIHFLLVGFGLFLYFAWRGDAVDPESRTITIDEEQVGRLVAGWSQTWRRAPTQSEIDGLIRDFVKEEIYYREGLRLGLDQDDAVIRRRVRSKMEFLANSQVENETPDDVVLQKLLDANPNAYASDARYSFDQIYLGQDVTQTARFQANQILAGLDRRTNWQSVGKAISLPSQIEATDRTRIVADFGEQFAAQLAIMAPGRWAGPVESGFGLHLVRVRKVEAASKPVLAEVRDKLEYDWRIRTARDREAKAYQALLDSYRIRIEQQ